MASYSRRSAICCLGAACLSAICQKGRVRMLTQKIIQSRCVYDSIIAATSIVRDEKNKPETKIVDGHSRIDTPRITRLLTCAMAGSENLPH